MTEYYFYKAHQNIYPRPALPNVKIVNNHFRYENEAPYEDIEKYDLRFVDRCTVDELFDKHLNRMGDADANEE